MSSVDRQSLAELQAIAQREGALKPASVVEAARDPASPLHRHFEWDDSEAAEKYRLSQAGFLIRRARVTIIPRDGADAINVRAFVSLESDRGKDGYRTVESVLANPAMASEMLSAALGDLRALRNKYRDLSELANVFIEIDKLLLAPEAFAQQALGDAVSFARQLEKNKGLDRTSAADRAAAAYKLPRGQVIEAMRASA